MVFNDSELCFLQKIKNKCVLGRFKNSKIQKSNIFNRKTPQTPIFWEIFLWWYIKSLDFLGDFPISYNFVCLTTGTSFKLTQFSQHYRLEAVT
jgi:hypothetical protein